MPKFAANLTMLFNEHDFLDRFAAAAKAGFKGVEYLFPYDFPTGAARRAAGEERPDAGAAQPAGRRLGRRRARHRRACPIASTSSSDGVGRAIDYATALGCQQVNCLAGIAPAGRARRRGRARRSSSNLRFAAAEAAAGRASSC